VNCEALRSGAYIAVDPAAISGSTVTRLTVDATTLAVSGGRTAQLVDDGGCAYTLPSNGVTTSKILVASSGVAVSRDTIQSGANSGRVSVSVVLPLQTVDTSELAGTWNSIDHGRDQASDPYSTVRLRYTLNGSGAPTEGTACANTGFCASLDTSVPERLVANPDGGWTMEENGVPIGRAFAVRGTDGHLSMFMVWNARLGFRIATKETVVIAPAAGSSFRTWDFSVDTTGFASALSEFAYTNTAVDASGTTTRLRTTDNRVDTLSANTPQTGMRTRATNACTINGAANTCAGLHLLALPGIGITAYMGIDPASFLGLAVIRP
jgi:hypothetical protein